MRKKEFLSFIIILALLLLFGCAEQKSECGNGICEKDENSAACSEDCAFVLAPEGKSCVASLECDDSNEMTEDSCDGTPKSCANRLKSCAAFGGEICGNDSFCDTNFINAVNSNRCCPQKCLTGPKCLNVLECDDKNELTKESCTGIPKQCVYELITECINGDAFCPRGCSSEKDADCTEMSWKCIDNEGGNQLTCRTISCPFLFVKGVVDFRTETGWDSIADSCCDEADNNCGKAEGRYLKDFFCAEGSEVVGEIKTYCEFGCENGACKQRGDIVSLPGSDYNTETTNEPPANPTQKLPNLVIDSVTFNPNPITEGAPYTATVKVSNPTDIPITEQFGVTAENSPQKKSKYSPNGIGANSQKEFFLTSLGPFSDSGEKAIIFKVDYEWHITESNENDNEFTQYLTVEPITSAHGKTETYYEGGTIIVDGSGSYSGQKVNIKITYCTSPRENAVSFSIYDQKGDLINNYGAVSGEYLDEAFNHLIQPHIYLSSVSRDETNFLCRIDITWP
ncbi:MAG: CARDB domain-containing protein [Candidatus Diapherotrites archaeon]